MAQHEAHIDSVQHEPQDYRWLLSYNQSASQSVAALFVLCIALLIPVPVHCLSPCTYTSSVTLASGQTQRFDRGGHGGCGAALVLQVADVTWTSSSYDVVDVDVLPRFLVTVDAAENVSIVYRDIVVDAAAMVGGASVVLVSIAATRLSNVNITLHNVTIVTSATDPQIALSQLVAVSAVSAVERVHAALVNCVFRLPIAQSPVDFTFNDAVPPVGSDASRVLWGSIAVRSVMLDRWGESVGRFGALCRLYSTNGGTTPRYSIVVSDSIVYLRTCNATVCDALVAFLYLVVRSVNVSVSRVNVTGTHTSVAAGDEGELDFLFIPNSFPQTGLAESVFELSNIHAELVTKSKIYFFRLYRQLDRCVVRVSNVTLIGVAVMPVLFTRRAALIGFSDVTRQSTIEIHSVVVDLKLLSQSGSNSLICCVLALHEPVVDVNVTMTSAALYCDVRNGSFVSSAPGLTAGGGSLRLSVVVTTAVAHSHLTLVGAVLYAMVGCEFDPTLTTGIMLTSYSIVNIQSSTSDALFHVEESRVVIALMEFQNLKIVSTPNVICFGALIGINTTSIITAIAADAGQAMCGLPADLFNTTETTFVITGCVVDNPYAGLRLEDGSGLLTHGGLFLRSVFVTARSGAALSKTFESPVRPQIALDCTTCTVLESTILVDDAKHVSTGVRCGIGRCVFRESTIRVSRTTFAASSYPLQNFFVVRTGSNATSLFTMPVSVVMQGVLVEFQFVNFTGVRFANLTDIPWEASSRLVLNCTRLGGSVITSPSSPSLAALVDVGGRLAMTVEAHDASCTSTTIPTTSANASLHPRGRHQAQDAVATIASIAGVVVSTVATSFAASGAFSAMHSAVFGVRLRSMCYVAGEADSSSQEEQRDFVGSAVLDNPTQIAIGAGDAAYTSGAVVGNAVLVIGWGAAHCAARWVYRRFVETAARRARTEPLGALFAAAATPMFCAVLQPAVAATVALLVLADDAGSIALGVVGTLVYVLPVVGVSWVTWVRFPLVARACSVPPGRLAYLVAVRSRWTLRGGRGGARKEEKTAAAALRARSQQLLLYLGPLLEPYRGGRAWVAAAELWLAVAQGVCSGVAAQLVATAGCAAADASLWVMFALGFAALVAVVPLRPYAAPLLTVQSVVMYLLSCVALLLSALGEEQAAAVVCIVQGCLSLALLLPSVCLGITNASMFCSKERADTFGSPFSDCSVFKVPPVRRPSPSGLKGRSAALGEPRLAEMPVLEALAVLVNVAAASARETRDTRGAKKSMAT